WDGLNPIGPPQPVMDGVATLSWMDLSVGSHALVAKYSGDDYYEPSQSQAVPHDVASGSSIVSLDAQPAQTQCGETVRLSAVVDPAAASGTVQFCDGLDPIGPPQAVSDGVATLSWTDLPAGTHTLIAKYSGDGSYGPSQSDAVSHEVNPIPTATTLGSNANPARFGTEVILTAQVGLGGASGTMRFFDQTGLIGSAPADPQSGVAALSVSDLAVGHHSLVARYDGDGCHAASSSPAYEQDVVPDNPPSVTVIAPNGGESLTVGQTVTLSWDARDDGPLPAVTLCVSRDDGATYEVIAADVPNSGTYAWTVTPPGTYRDASPLYSALLQV